MAATPATGRSRHAARQTPDALVPRSLCAPWWQTLAVVLHGCAEHTSHTRWKRHCSLQGQWLLCDEDIEFLAQLELPEPAEQQLLPHVAVMVDTSWRPQIQHYVVHNVHNNTGWPIQLFHGPSNGPKLRALFSDLLAAGQLTLTDIKEDYMEVRRSAGREGRKGRDGGGKPCGGVA